MATKKNREVLHIRLTEQEKAKVKKKAEAVGLTMSSYVRMLIKTAK